MLRRDRRDGVTGAGWKTLFVAIDNQARIAFTAMHSDEKTAAGGAVLEGRGGLLRQIKHRFTCAYRPQTSTKAQRFIQSALREWACGWTYQN